MAEIDAADELPALAQNDEEPVALIAAPFRRHLA